MNLQNIYRIFMIAGLVFPGLAFYQFIKEYGLDMGLFVTQMFETHISSFFSLDVIVSAIVLLVFIVTEGKRKSIQRLWAPVAATFLIGVSFGLPMFLYMREKNK